MDEAILCPLYNVELRHVGCRIQNSRQGLSQRITYPDVEIETLCSS